jgi:hypothetical protein
MAAQKKKKIPASGLTIPQIHQIFGGDEVLTAGATNKRIVDMLKRGEIKRIGTGVYDGEMLMKLLITKRLMGAGSSRSIITDKGHLANRTERKKAQADLAELNNKIEANEMVEINRVKSYLTNHILQYKAVLLRLSRSLPMDVFGCTEEDMLYRIHNKLKRDCESCLGACTFEEFEAIINEERYETFKKKQENK